MNYYLAQLSIPEDDVFGIRIFSEDAWQEYLDRAEEYFEANETYTLYFGHSEEIPYESFERLIQDLDYKKIQKKEALVIKKYVFKEKDTLGTFPQF